MTNDKDTELVRELVAGLPKEIAEWHVGGLNEKRLKKVADAAEHVAEASLAAEREGWDGRDLEYLVKYRVMPTIKRLIVANALYHQLYERHAHAFTEQIQETLTTLARVAGFESPGHAGAYFNAEVMELLHDAYPRVRFTSRLVRV